ncbi:MAG: hypothetical protein HYT10_00445 [Candidatus Levybacteria bacterium]|nr:hypothetical protein [Candidatus Levybacteria bacterium]
MTKRRKTRKEKIIADLQRKLQKSPQISTPDSTFTLQSQNDVLKKYLSSPLPLKRQIKTDTLSYAFIRHDLLKTVTLTTGILTFELLLYFILKNHMVTLPMVGY